MVKLEVQGINWLPAAAKSLQSCPTLCDPIHGSPPGSPIPGILQARTLEWVAISFSDAWKWKVKVKSVSHVRLFSTSWTAAYQAAPSMGFSRQEYWSGLPLPSPANSYHVLKASPYSKEQGRAAQTGYWRFPISPMCRITLTVIMKWPQLYLNTHLDTLNTFFSAFVF